jgi:hypothetical protein
MPAGSPSVAVIISCAGSKLSKPICCLYDCPAIAGGTFTVSTDGLVESDATVEAVLDAANADPADMHNDKARVAPTIARQIPRARDYY